VFREVPVRYLFESVVVDAERRQLLRNGAEVHLPPKAFALLLFLIGHRPNAVAKADVMAHVWPDTFVSDATLTSLVADIREAIGDTGRDARIIRTLHRFGYAFIADMELSVAADDVRPVLGWLLGDSWRLPLRSGEIVLGREGDGVVPLPSSSVSRRHAAIVMDGRSATVTDLGSKNGTFVDDVRADAATALRDGAQVRLGTLVLTFRTGSGASSTETV
jgi:DNA-binding winged helix-turn-helix (wHTH) protein